MLKKITLLLILGTFSTGLVIAQSFTALYSFDSVKTTSGLTDPTAVTVVTGVTFGSFSATGTPVNPNATSRFTFTDWAVGATSGNDLYSSLIGSVNTAEYYEVTVTPVTGYTVDLSSIAFSAQRSGTGIRTYSVRSSADAYGANLPASINPANTNLSVQTGDVFFWNFDATSTNQNGSTITLTGSSFTAISTPITFRFYGWNSEASGGTFSIDNVTIAGNIISPVTANFSATNVCLGESTAFTDLSTTTNASINITVWDFGDGSPWDYTPNPTHYYSAPGMYIVTLGVEDNLSIIDTIVDSVYVYDKPDAGWAITTSPGTGVCAEKIVYFTNVSSIINGTITNDDWNFGDPGSGANNVSTLLTPSHTYNTAASYMVTQIVTSNMGCKDTASLNISVEAKPIANFSFALVASTVNFTDLTVGASSWLWEFGDPSTTNDFSTIQNPSYTYPVDLPITACLTVTNAAGCADSVCEVIFTVGINKTSLETITTVYPNPSTNGIFTVNTGDSSNGTTVTVYNIIGKIILSKKINPLNKVETIDLSNEANGSYFVNIKNDKENSTKKIIINK